MKEKIAKIIRILTIPPMLTLIMLLALRHSYGENFASTQMFYLAIITLVMIPMLAYPLSFMKKSDPKITRERQRQLAFVMNLIGYFLAFIFGIIMKCSQMFLSIIVSYFFGVVLLTFLNKVCKTRASGHACSCVLPYMYLCYWLKSSIIFICILCYAIEFWASIELKRHTVSEFLQGTIVAILAFAFPILYFTTCL